MSTVPTLIELAERGEFEHAGSTWKLVSDSLGWILMKDGYIEHEYANRAGVAEDILRDIGITQQLDKEKAMTEPSTRDHMPEDHEPERPPVAQENRHACKLHMVTDPHVEHSFEPETVFRTDSRVRQQLEHSFKHEPELSLRIGGKFFQAQIRHEHEHMWAMSPGQWFWSCVSIVSVGTALMLAYRAIFLL